MQEEKNLTHEKWMYDIDIYFYFYLHMCMITIETGDICMKPSPSTAQCSPINQHWLNGGGLICGLTSTFAWNMGSWWGKDLRGDQSTVRWSPQ